MERRQVAIDTDTSSLIFKKCLPSALEAKLAVVTPVLPFVTRGELEAGMWSRNWGEAKRKALRDWMAEHTMLRGGQATARAFGVIAAAARRRGRPRSENDTWIAACCIAHELPLATLNVKDFRDFAVYHGLELITA
jgi:predicted nucleic acid-binding protein